MARKFRVLRCVTQLLRSCKAAGFVLAVPPIPHNRVEVRDVLLARVDAELVAQDVRKVGLEGMVQAIHQ